MSLKRNGGAAEGIVLGTKSGTQGTGFLKLRYYASDMVFLQAYGDSYMVGGNLGIGTKFPSNKLDITGGIDIDNYIRHNGDENTYIGFPSNDNIGLYTGGYKRLTVNSNGYVGIGTTSPSHKLTVNGKTKIYYNSAGNDSELEMQRISTNQFQGLQSEVTSTNSSTTAYGVVGIATSNYNSLMETAIGVYGEASSPTPHGGLAGYFNGNLAYSGSLLTVSDLRLKKNIKDLPNALDNLMELSPKQYDYRELKNYNFSRGTHSGFLAQEVQNIFPELVSRSSLPSLPQKDSVESKIHVDYLSMDYTGLIPYIVKSIQEQQNIIESQGALINDLMFNNNLIASSDLVKDHIPHIVKISPNPTQDDIVVEYYTGGSEATLIINNNLGEEQGVYGAGLDGKTTITLNFLEDGIYILSLSVNGKIFDTKRFIFNK